MAQNLASLTHLRWTRETSLLKTWANKNRTSVSQTGRRLRGTAQTPYGPRRGLKITIPREGKKPLTAICGGLSRPRRPQTAIKDSGLLPDIPYRSEVLDKRLRATCELCGITGEVEMHHLRKLADLNQHACATTADPSGLSPVPHGHPVQPPEVSGERLPESRMTPKCHVRFGGGCDTRSHE